jgi:hypothetical protein
MAEKPTIPDFPTLPDFGKMITQACEVVASVRGIPYDFNGTLSLENKFVVLFKTVKEMFDAQDALVKSYKELYEFVHTYFDNLDVQEEINKKLDDMSREGTLLNIIKPTVTNETTKWLADHITNPTSPAIDKSLTVQGAAADSFMTGSLLSSLFSPNSNYFRENLGEGTTFTDGHYIGSDGKIHVNVDYSYSDYIAVPPRTSLQIKSGIDTFVCVYNENKEFIYGYYSSNAKNVNLLDDARFIRYSIVTSKKYLKAIINPMYTLQSELLANFYHGAFSNTIILPQTLRVNGYYANWDTGKLTPNDKYFCSPYLRALNGTIICDTTTSADNVFAVSFYDSNFTMISSAYNKTVVPIPKNAYYFCFSKRIDIAYDVKIISNSTTLTVSKDNSKMFTSINAALKFAYAIESKENPITIIVFPGVYKEVLFIKGQHYVSLIGINRETCIIRDDTAHYNNAPLRIQGACYVANLTFIATADKYSSTTGTGYNAWKKDVLAGVSNPTWLTTLGSYAVHCDDVTNGETTTSIFENCYMYSVTFPAFGAGMQLNNTIYLLNCDLLTSIDEEIYNANKLNSQGTIVCHGNYPTSPVDDPKQSLVVKDCRISAINSKCLNMYKSDNAPNANIIFINNTFSNNHKNSVDDILTFTFDTKNINSASHGNNVEFFNKTLLE